MQPRLPNPGNDEGSWGNILNDYLSVEHNPDGTLKKSADIAAATSVANSAAATASAKYTKPTTGIPETDLASAVQSKLNAVGTGTGTIADGSIVEAKLSSAVQTKLNAPTTITAGSITDSHITANANIAQTKISGLAASFSAKQDATTAAATFAPKASPTFTGTVTVPAPTNATDAATKAYVDANGGTGTTPDATTTISGKVRLAGDLTGTATAPTIAAGVITEAKLAAAVQTKLNQTVETSNVIVLEVAEAIPSNTPEGTLIFRKSS